MLKCDNNLIVTLVSSQAIKSTFDKIYWARGVNSSKLPIGVATIYKAFSIFSILLI